MPGSYKCPKGGAHDWQTKTQDGLKIRVCAKCGEARPQ